MPIANIDAKIQYLTKAINDLKTLGQIENFPIQDVLNEDGDIILSQDRIRAIIEQIKGFLEFYKDSYESNPTTEHEESINSLFETGEKIYFKQYLFGGQSFNFRTIPTVETKDAGIMRNVTLNLCHLQDLININFLTNTKLSNGQENTTGYLGAGSYKSVKTCINIRIEKGVAQQPKFMARGSSKFISCSTTNLKDIAKADEKMQNLITESSISQKFNPQFVATLELGPLYMHSKKPKFQEIHALYTFSEIALCTLDKIYSYLPFEEQQKISSELSEHRLPKLYYKLFTDYLKGLKEIHSSDAVHGDVKFDNALIYFNPQTGEYTAKISDLGLTHFNDQEISMGCTEYYASPQMLKSVAPRKINTSASLAAERCRTEDVLSVKRNDSSHDMWSFGIMLFVALANGVNNPKFGKGNISGLSTLQKITKKYPIVGALLSTDMAKRPDVYLALKQLRIDYLINSRNEKIGEQDLHLLRNHLNYLNKKSKSSTHATHATHGSYPNNTNIQYIKLLVNKIMDVENEMALNKSNETSQLTYPSDPSMLFSDISAISVENLQVEDGFSSLYDNGYGTNPSNTSSESSPSSYSPTLVAVKSHLSQVTVPSVTVAAATNAASQVNGILYRSSLGDLNTSPTHLARRSTIATADQKATVECLVNTTLAKQTDISFNSPASNKSQKLNGGNKLRYSPPV